MSDCECYKVGGPFIAEDPDCPMHGANGAQSELDRLRALTQQQAEQIVELEMEKYILHRQVNFLRGDVISWRERQWPSTDQSAVVDRDLSIVRADAIAKPMPKAMKGGE